MGAGKTQAGKSAPAAFPFQQARQADSACLLNKQTARSARQCCEACYQFRKNLWITGLSPGRFEVGKRAGSKGRTGPLRRPQAFPETLVSKPSKPANAAVPAFLAFPALLPLSSACTFLMNKQADTPQRPSMLRRALSIQEKSVDKSGLFGPFRAVLKWARRFSGLALFGRNTGSRNFFLMWESSKDEGSAPAAFALAPACPSGEIELPNESANRPQRPPMLRRALSIREKSVDKSGLPGPFPSGAAFFWAQARRKRERVPLRLSLFSKPARPIRLAC